MPTADTVTYKMWIGYTWGSLAHELLLRFDQNPNVDTSTQTVITGIAAAMAACLPTSDGITGGRVASPGAAFSLPYTPIITQAGTLTPGTITQEALATFAGMSARSTQGIDWTAHFFCQAAVPFNEYRLVTASIPTPLSGWVSAMKAVVSGRQLRAIDGNTLLHKGYVNFGQNAYWQRRQR